MLTPLLCLFFALEACTSSMNFMGSSAVPAATGKAEVKRDKNDNYQIQVWVRNLAPADRLSPPARTYAVWVETDRTNVRKLGLLEPRNKALEARLTASVAAEPTRVFITAENNPETQYPAGTEMLSTRRK